MSNVQVLPALEIGSKQLISMPEFQALVPLGNWKLEVGHWTFLKGHWTLVSLFHQAKAAAAIRVCRLFPTL